MAKDKFVWGAGDIKVIKTPVGEVITDYSDVKSETKADDSETETIEDETEEVDEA